MLAILDRQEMEESQPKKKKRRTTKNPRKTVRHFKCPKLDWTARYYYNWIDNIKPDQRTMPPVFLGLSRQQLQEAARLGRASSLGLEKFKGNTQCVEREIKIQTEMSLHVKSQERREQESSNLHWSLDRMPGWMNSKQDYINHHDGEPEEQQQKVASRVMTRSASSKKMKK